MNVKTALVLSMLLGPGAAFAQSSGKSDTIHPNPNTSVGGSKSERTNDGNVLPKESPQTGTVEKGTGASDYSQPRSRDKKQPRPQPAESPAIRRWAKIAISQIKLQSSKFKVDTPAQAMGSVPRGLVSVFRSFLLRRRQNAHPFSE